MDGYVKIGKAAELLGVSVACIRKWTDAGKLKFIRSPGGTRLVEKSQCLPVNTRVNVTETNKYKVFYCRVSSVKQSDDLARQISLAQQLYPGHEIIKDVGSGINWKRKGLLSLLDRSLRGEIEEVVVFHRDRLCRFAFELIEHIFTAKGTRLMVHKQDDLESNERELADDVMAIIHVFSCRQMGKRKYNGTRIKEDPTLPVEGTEADLDPVDGRQ